MFFVKGYHVQKQKELFVFAERLLQVLLSRFFATQNPCKSPRHRDNTCFSLIKNELVDFRMPTLRI